jgi:hypothetical protein
MLVGKRDKGEMSARERMQNNNHQNESKPEEQRSIEDVRENSGKGKLQSETMLGVVFE